MKKYFLSGALLAIMLMAGPVFAQVDSMEADVDDEFAGSTTGSMEADVDDEFAGSTDGSMEADVEDELVDNSDAGLTPDSPFYFLDSWGESLNLFFTFNNEKKAEKRLKFAEEKLAELEQLAADGDIDPEKLQKRIDKSLSKYETHLKRLDARLDKIPNEVLARVGEMVAVRTDLHQDVLDRVMDRVPEKAKARIHDAAAKSQQGHLRALRALSSVDPVASAELVMDQHPRCRLPPHSA